MFASTPEPPYVAVIFTATLSGLEEEKYQTRGEEIRHLAGFRPGFLGVESGRGESEESSFELTVSYWVDEEAAMAFKRDLKHLQAQQEGRDTWFSRYVVRVARVNRTYSWP